MRRDHLAFLIGGFAFGVLAGYATFHAIERRPGASRAEAASEDVQGPKGPMAATQVGASAPAGSANSGAAAAGAPMIGEINALKRALQDDPKNVRAAIRLGNLYHDVGEWKQAIQFYEKATEIDPRNADVLTDTGICWQQLEDFDRALACFRQAQTVDPSHWQSLYNVAVVAGLALHRFDEADAAVARLETIQPKAPNLAELKSALQDARRRGGAS